MSSAITATERDPPSHESERPVALIGAGVALGVDRVPVGRGRRRAAARPDEDAVTLAAEACAIALDGFEGSIGTVCFVTTTPPYQEGGSVQPLVEILGLQGDIYALELTGSWRDGLAGIRLARSLADDLGPMLLCSAHADAEDPATGDGAVALLLGAASEPAGSDRTVLAKLTPAASSAAELRDRWRLPGDSRPREADKSFVQAIGTERLAADLIAMVPEGLSAPPAVIGPDARCSASVERSLGGPGDEISSHTGIIGAAHPLLRLLAGLDAEALVVAVANGLGEALHVAPTPAGDRFSAVVRERAGDQGHAVERAMARPEASDFDPFSSAPRSWRDRASDLRLEDLLPPSALPAGSAGREYPRGAVIAWTADMVYPAAPVTEMVAVEMDGGGRFFGQVAMGEHVAIGDRVELVPRRLHEGGGVIQYFWKARVCR